MASTRCTSATRFPGVSAPAPFRRHKPFRATGAIAQAVIALSTSPYRTTHNR